MKAPLPLGFFLACRRQGCRPSRWVLAVTTANQTLRWFERVADYGFYTFDLAAFPLHLTLPKRGPQRVPCKVPAFPGAPFGEKPIRPNYWCRRVFRVSTSRWGLGQQRDSHQTPRGLHRIAEKIGGGAPAGTVFRSRQPVGLTWAGHPRAAIAHRILWLDGLEPGKNRGGTVDTHARYIYLHGLGDETTLGRPTSRGCIHLAADDLIPLFDRLPVGTLVWIE